MAVGILEWRDWRGLATSWANGRAGLRHPSKKVVGCRLASVRPSFRPSKRIPTYVPPVPTATYVHGCTWALRRVLAFGFVQEYLGTYSYQPMKRKLTHSLSVYWSSLREAPFK
eukprot:scaffold2701_cov137-Skeletonema_dohrnii-CCMP3373.AAC.12